MKAENTRENPEDNGLERSSSLLSASLAPAAPPSASFIATAHSVVVDGNLYRA